MSQKHPLRILVAEDNSVNQKVAARLLGKLGYKADFAANGAEALAALSQQTYDVVLMDVYMPVLDGLGATREICRRFAKSARPRIIAMTGAAMDDERAACFAAGMDDYITKPVAAETLIQSLLACKPAR
jgi:CheY-like chemotaxis protein